MLRPTATVLLVLGLMAAGSTRQPEATTLTLGSATGIPGTTVSLPVALRGATRCSAALLRVEFDSARFERPTAIRGPLLVRGQTLDSFSPAPGRLNVVAYPTAGAPEFTSNTGTLCLLVFSVKSAAPLGLAPVTFTTAGVPSLPNADLATSGAIVVTPATVPGSITVTRPPTRAHESWARYR